MLFAPTEATVSFGSTASPCSSMAGTLSPCFETPRGASTNGVPRSNPYFFSSCSAARPRSAPVAPCSVGAGAGAGTGAGVGIAGVTARGTGTGATPGICDGVTCGCGATGARFAASAASSSASRMPLSNIALRRGSLSAAARARSSSSLDGTIPVWKQFCLALVSPRRISVSRMMLSPSTIPCFPHSRIAPACSTHSELTRQWLRPLVQRALLHSIWPAPTHLLRLSPCRTPSTRLRFESPEH